MATRPRPPRLIVNADDLGLSDAVNRAIFDAHRLGILTSTSLMACGPAFDAAVAGWKQHSTLGVGVHLVLHEERPVSDPSLIPSLVDEHGRLKPLKQVVRRLLTGQVEAAEVEREYDAQLAKVRAAGIQPTHIDSHCHLHAFPAIAGIAARVAWRHGVRAARRPRVRAWSDFQGAPWGRYPLGLLISACQMLSERKLPSSLRSPDRFFGLIRSGALDTEWLLATLPTLPAGSISEIMVHPGDGSGPGQEQQDHGPAQRRVEYEALVSPRVRERIAELGVELVNYSALA